jgi:hypothetical protein
MPVRTFVAYGVLGERGARNPFALDTLGHHRSALDQGPPAPGHVPYPFIDLGNNCRAVAGALSPDPRGTVPPTEVRSGSISWCFPGAPTRPSCLPRSSGGVSYRCRCRRLWGESWRVRLPILAIAISHLTVIPWAKLPFLGWKGRSRNHCAY